MFTEITTRIADWPREPERLAEDLAKAFVGDVTIRLPSGEAQNYVRYAVAFNAMQDALEWIAEASSRSRRMTRAEAERLSSLVDEADAELNRLRVDLLRQEVADPDSQAQIQSRYREVYEFCPPTLTHFQSPESRDIYFREWTSVIARAGLTANLFPDARLLDVGCGSGEKAGFYARLGAKVTGTDMTAAVLRHARERNARDNVEIVQCSLFELPLSQGEFDIVISDGVLHHAADTYTAYTVISRNVRTHGVLAVSLVNVWGALWWFEYARLFTRLIAGPDFHGRAAVGERLFRCLRPGQEGTSETSDYARSVDSWAYDWFATPNWNQHRPQEFRKWMTRLNLGYRCSDPELDWRRYQDKSEIFEPSMWDDYMHLFWLANREWNTVFFSAERIG
jgi:2-polyprenyl-3-methyl-5-hydroxy-6-metoxy-1,4-benzoquinol methylase